MADGIGVPAGRTLSTSRPIGPRPTRRGVRNGLIHAGVFATLVILLQLGTMRFGRILVPAPAEVAAKLATGLTDGSLFEAWMQSIGQLAVATLVTVAIGIPLGVLLGRFRTFDDLAAPAVSAGYLIPRIALMPVIMLWFGYQDVAKVLFILTFCFFEVVLTVRAGVQTIDVQYVEVSRAYCLSESWVLRKVVAPAIVPYIVTGLRIGLLYGLVGVVLAGFFFEANGIGGVVYEAVHNYRSADLFAAVITIAAAGLLISTILRRIERRVTPWRAVAAA